MIFHLAIPCKDIIKAYSFYQSLGAHVGRKYKTHVVLHFFDIQLVCHQSGLYDQEPTMYPRHFGIIVDSEAALKELWNRWQYGSFVFEEYFVRHKDKREEHHTFFLKDPSNNLIEFKWYKNKAAIFN